MNTKANIVESFSRSFKHTEKILFKPFNLVKWLKLGFISLFIGGGGFSGFNYNFNDFNKYKHKELLYTHSNDWLIIKSKIISLLSKPDILGYISLAVLAAIVLFFIFIWLNSVFHFVFIDNIIKNSAFIKEPFHRLKPKGNSLFLWFVAITIISIVISAVLILAMGINIDAAQQFNQTFNILWIILFALIFIVFIICISVLITLVTDFVVPIMYAEDVKITKGWEFFKPIAKNNIGGLITYFLLKLVIAVMQAILGVIATVASLIIVGIPTAIIAVIGFIIGSSLNLTWSVATILLAGVFGIIAFCAFIYIAQVILMPIEVLKKTFALDILGQFKDNWNLLNVSYTPAAAIKTAQTETPQRID